MGSSDLIATIVIPAYLRPQRLLAAARSAVLQDMDPDKYEVVVVDSSPDEVNLRNIEELSKEARCSLRCLRKLPEGPGPSRNLGARQGTGRFIAFMDSDCQASPQWLREGVAQFEDRVGIVSGTILPEPNVPHTVWNHKLEVLEESFLYHAANVMYRREAFEQIGGFPSDIHPNAEHPMGGEDVELAWRVKRAGWQSRFAKEAVMYHEVIRVTPWRWVWNKNFYIVPRAISQFPELRKYFYARYFFDKTHAWLALALLGIILGFIKWPAFLLTLPYIVRRVSEPSATLRGVVRLSRAVMYFPRDVATMVLLLAGSVRFRALLL